MEEKGREFVTPEIEKRQHRRAKLVSEIRCEALGREELLLTRDVSAEGLFVAARNPFPAESEVSVSFRMQPAGPTISCRGRIVYALKGIGMGVQFTNLEDQDRSTLEKFVDESD